VARPFSTSASGSLKPRQSYMWQTINPELLILAICLKQIYTASGKLTHISRTYSGIWSRVGCGFFLINAHMAPLQHVEHKLCQQMQMARAPKKWSCVSRFLVWNVDHLASRALKLRRDSGGFTTNTA